MKAEPMKIGIDASRAFLHERTGIEEYSYQLIKHLRTPLERQSVVLYIRKGTAQNIQFTLPEKWEVRELWAPRLWTYVRLSWELLVRRVDRLLVPGHIAPPVHPRHTVSIIHGIEYEIYPQAYSWHARSRMRRGIKNSIKWSKWVICVSNNTKRDVARLYNVPKEKMRVVYEGFTQPPEKIDTVIEGQYLRAHDVRRGEYLLFVGRLEERKNIINVLKAFEILKEHFRSPYKLVLAGKPGYGWKQIADEIDAHPYTKDIILPGFVGEEEKWALMRNASVFVFPTLYEGFGLPVLEAQGVGVPVVTSAHSSLAEVARESAFLADPHNTADVAEKMHIAIADHEARKEMIARGYENIKRFDWRRAAKLVAKVLMAGR